VPENDLVGLTQAATEGPQRAQFDERMRNELIALCQAQEEQRRRIDAATQRRFQGTNAEKENETDAATVIEDHASKEADAGVRIDITAPISASLERARALADIARSDLEGAFRSITEAFDDPTLEVRNAAARALYDWRSHRSTSFARALCEARPDRRQRIGAALATSGLAAEAVANLTGANREKTYDAFSLLFLMAKTGEVQALVEIIQSYPSIEVRLVVIKLITLSGRNEIIPSFRRMADDASVPDEVRIALTKAIAQLN